MEGKPKVTDVLDKCHWEKEGDKLVSVCQDLASGEEMAKLLQDGVTVRVQVKRDEPAAQK